MRVYKDGIYRTIESYEYGRYFSAGWKKIGGNPEPQAPQENIKVVDDLTVTKEEEPAVEETKTEPVVEETEQPKLIVKPKKPKNK